MLLWKHAGTTAVVMRAHEDTSLLLRMGWKLSPSSLWDTQNRKEVKVSLLIACTHFIFGLYCLVFILFVFALRVAWNLRPLRSET